MRAASEAQGGRGIIPPADHAALRAAGAEAIFPPSTVVTDAARKILDAFSIRLGYHQQRPAA